MIRPPLHRRGLLAFVLAFALFATSCATSAETTGSAEPTEATEPADASDDSTTTSTAAAVDAGSQSLDTKPVVLGRTDPVPTELVITDLIKGTGAEAVAGSTVSVQYVGVRYEDGVQFDSSWDRGQPFEFVLGVGQVIQGWDQGFAGMLVGGRRELIIPADLAYGEAGAGADIGPNQALIFVVDMLDVISPYPEPLEETASRVVVPNQGRGLEGTALSSSDGAAYAMLIGDELAEDVPAGEGLEAWITFGLEEVVDTLAGADFTSVTLRSQAMQNITGDPFGTLGELTATLVDDSSFPPTDADRAVDNGSVVCVPDVEATALSCDVAELIADAVSAGEDRVTFRLRFDTPSNLNGEPDMVFFFITDQFSNDVGIFTLEFNLA